MPTTTLYRAFQKGNKQNSSEVRYHSFVTPKPRAMIVKAMAWNCCAARLWL